MLSNKIGEFIAGRVLVMQWLVVSGSRDGTLSNEVGRYGLWVDEGSLLGQVATLLHHSAAVCVDVYVCVYTY